MLTEETVKKLWLWGMIGVLVLGAFWLIFVVLFNRGSIRLEAEPPYRVEISGVISERCTENPCIITVAPGDYTVWLEKENFNELAIKVTVPLGGEAVEAVEFVFKPIIGLIGMESELGYFKTSDYQVSEEEITGFGLPEKIFSEENFVVYINRNVENGRQTLFFREFLADLNSLSEVKVATSFIRDLTDWNIYPFIDQAQKIVLVDKSNDKSVLYLIDLKEKTRDNILEHALISGVKWIPGTEKFLYEARDFGSQYSGLFTYDTETKMSVAQNVSASIDNVGFIDQGRFIAATTANELVEYNLLSGISRVLMADETGGEVQQIKMAPDRMAVFLLKGDNIYELRFAR